MDLDEEEEEEEEEDEEILRLKLQAIQAKLRLKKLQSAKAKKASETGGVPSRPRSTSIPTDTTSTTRPQSRVQGIKFGLPSRPQSQADIQIPASPVKKAQAEQSQTSPSRVRLGIDKGLRGKDVSLKRAPSLRKASETQNGPQSDGYQRRVQTPSLGTRNDDAAQERPKTFSERLAAARSEELSRQERQARIRQARSTAFELGKDEMDHLKSNATDIPDAPQEPAQFSREEVLSASRLRRSNTTSSLRRPSQDESRSSSALSRSFEASDSQSRASTSRKTEPPSEVPEEEASAFEPYSSIHLSKRIIPHPVLTRNLGGKKTYLINDLLRDVKAPEFELPEIEQDIVVFAILASKSDPRSHRPANNLREKAEPDPERGKYMVLKLVDLQWELELFLFNTGFDRYWKLTPGTLLAILNPTVMPPPPGRTDTGRFGLVINSGQDTILEVGTARDLGFCKSVRKDGGLCNSWVNRRRTEFCEFHMNAALAKHRQARQDINAFDSGLGPGGSSRKRTGPSGRWGERGRAGGPADDRARGGEGAGGRYDRDGQGQGTHWFVSRASSAASMLDNEFLPGQVAERVERGEALRRRLATQEKERDLMKSLGQVGTGAGREYMLLGEKQRAARAAADGSATGEDAARQQQQEDAAAAAADAKSLGLLLGGKGSEQPKIHLSPVKRKRTNTLASLNGGGGGSSSSLSSSLMTSSSFPGGTTTATNTTAAAAIRSRSGNSNTRRLGGTATATATATAAAAASSSSSSSSFPTPASALGWGGGLRDKLARMKDGEKLRGLGSNSSSSGGGGGGGGGRDADRSPVRKKTRFVTEKGIREAGRESLGGGELSRGGTTTSSTTTAATDVFYTAAAGTATATATAERARGRMVVLEDDDDDDELVILR